MDLTAEGWLSVRVTEAALLLYRGSPPAGAFLMLNMPTWLAAVISRSKASGLAPCAQDRDLHRILTSSPVRHQGRPEGVQVPSQACS